MSEPEKKRLVWKDKDVTTVGQLSDVVVDIANREDRVEAKQLLEFFADRTSMEIAVGNVGYLSGYCGTETMRKIQDVFDVNHPVFGRSVPSPEEAIMAGRMMAEGKS